jgi:diguanylate cyclase (GGDEF)-like protein/PAS domain S-box-containing protein
MSAALSPLFCGGIRTITCEEGVHRLRTKDIEARPIGARLRQIEAREWWLWVFAVTVTLALSSAIIALTFPGFHLGAETWFWLDLKERVRGLAALVLIFDIYTVYQHFQLQRLRKQLNDQKDLFEVITENAADMIAVVDKNGNRLYNSPAYARVLGYSIDELQNYSASEQIHPDDKDRVLQAAAKARTSNVVERLEYRMLHKNGTWRVLESSASAIRNESGALEKLVIVNRDITERKRAEQMLVHNAFHDQLTNLPNRALFLDRLQHAIIRARRHSDFRFAVLFVDVDDFKILNDSMGHSAGDELLVQLAERLAISFRESDTISRASSAVRFPISANDSLARLGGDEFTILLEDIASAGDAVRVARRIQEKCRIPFVIKGQELVISTSFGIALSSATYAKAEHVVRDAELAMYRAKQSGKDGCEVFDPTMHATAVRRLTLETELRHAVESGELKVYYQPIVSLDTGRVLAFEALSRWVRPEGMVSPAEFIPVADESGLIIPINRLLMRDACDQLRRWQREFPSDPPLTMSVNIAPRQFIQSDLAADIQSIIEQAQIEPCTLQLEIIETTAMGDAERATDVLAALKAIGVRLSIDDFGTGYSSLARLQSMPVDSLKVDRSFISTMEDNLDSQEIVRMIVAMAHALKLKVVAEGTETEKQIQLLRLLGCEMAQGYFFARPVPPENISHLLEKSNTKPGKPSFLTR